MSIDEKIFIIVLIGLLVLICISLIYKISNRVSIEKKMSDIDRRISYVEEHIDYVKIENSPKLNVCKYCGGPAEIIPIMDYYYIKCSGCKLSTGYWRSKSRLIEHWNGWVEYKSGDDELK